MSLTVALLGLTCAVAIGVALCTPTTFARSPASRIKPQAVLPPPASRSLEVCCPDLGCYNSGGGFFDLLNRPINSIPKCDLASKLKLYLNTRKNPISTQLLDHSAPQTIANSNFNASKLTVVTIHGFIDNYQWPWWRETVKELLAEGDYNVIRVDWSHGNTLPYLQACANLRLVGAYVATFLLFARDQYGLDPANVHVVGHSLGAHGAGYVGNVMRQANATIGRITGLDPAGPYFTSLPAEVRLDPTDATFVDTIITDGLTIFTLSMGSAQPMGHVNFYPNGGKHQPGCGEGILQSIISGPTMNSTSFDLISMAVATGMDTVACSHARAVVLFYESINNKACTMKAYQCTDYDKFLRGDCFECAGRKCTTLGWHVDQSLGERNESKKFYSITTEQSPFCTTPHKVSFTIQNKTTENSSVTRLGHVYITLVGSAGSSGKIRLTPNLTELKPGQTYTYFFETRALIGQVESVIFYWDNKINLLNPMDWILNRYLWVEGNILLKEADELISVFSLATNKVPQEKDARATLIYKTYGTL